MADLYSKYGDNGVAVGTVGGADNAIGAQTYDPGAFAAVASKPVTISPAKPTTAPPATSPITSATLTPAPTLNYQAPSVPPEPAINALDTTVAAPTVDPYANTGQQNEVQRRINEQLGLNDSLTGKSEYQAQQENAAGLPDLYKIQTELASRVKSLQNEAQAIPLQLQQDATGRGITEGGLRPIQTAALRNNAIQALSANSLLESSKGNITLAQNLVDRAVAAKYGKIEAQIAANDKNLALVLQSPNYTNEQKKQAQAQADANAKKTADIATKKTDTATIMSWASAALANGATPYQAEQIMKIAQGDSPDLKAAFALYAPHAKDPQATAKALAELEQTRAQTAGTLANNSKTPYEIAKLQADIASTNANTTKTFAETAALGNGSGGVGAYISEVTNKPLSDTERAALGYADRMKDSSSIIDTIGANFTSQSSHGGILPNQLQSAERQQYEQAKKDFVNAKLRKESGAAISPTEFDSADQQYFPQAGDSSEVLAQKKANRQLVTANLYLEGGKPSLGKNLSTNGGSTLTSADGTQQVNLADLTPEQIQEAKAAGWK